MSYKIESITGQSKTVFQVWLTDKKQYWLCDISVKPYEFFTKKSAIENIKQNNSDNFNDVIENYEIHKIEYITLTKNIEIV